jgi:hypothetical protein
VKTHLRHTYTKLDVASRAAAVERATALGLIQLGHPPAEHAEQLPRLSPRGGLVGTYTSTSTRPIIG